MATRTQTNPLEKRETSNLIGSDKVEGTPVYRSDGDSVGQIERVMIDKLSGKVAYAIMSFGGFLGIGDSYHPLPWRALRYDEAQGGFVVNIDRSRLEGAPTYTTSDLNRWDDRSYGTRVNDYYGV